MQNGFGCEMNASASASFCLARRCAGIGGGSATFRLRFFHQRHSSNAATATVSTTSPHQSQAQPSGISTGGLMSRMSLAFVTAGAIGIAAASEARCRFLAPAKAPSPLRSAGAVQNTPGFGLWTLDFGLIPAASVSRGSQKTCQALRRNPGLFAIESRQCPPCETAAAIAPVPSPAVRRTPSVCARHRC